MQLLGRHGRPYTCLQQLARFPYSPPEMEVLVLYLVLFSSTTIARTHARQSTPPDLPLLQRSLRQALILAMRQAANQVRLIQRSATTPTRTKCEYMRHFRYPRSRPTPIIDAPPRPSLFSRPRGLPPDPHRRIVSQPARLLSFCIVSKRTASRADTSTIKESHHALHAPASDFIIVCGSCGQPRVPGSANARVQ